MLPSLLALALGPIVAGAVWRAGMLTGGGAVAAAAVGSASALAGLDWVTLLLGFFISSVMLGRVGKAEKQRRSANIIEKSGARDAVQVLANGAVFGTVALFAARGSAAWPLASVGLGALAAATADTWGTEIGMLSRSAPRSILTAAPLEPGMSGGVSVLGLVATVGGAASIGILATALRWPVPVAMAAAAGGVVGALSDSFLGASVQQRRRSAQTGRVTERLTDSDGTPTTHAGGLDWLTNDGVNFAATLIGGGTAWQLYTTLGQAGRE